MTETRVTMTIAGGVADVRLSRPDKINAFDLAMFDALGATIDRIAAAPVVRCVVLSGEGRGFSAGIDLAAFASGTALGDLMPRTHGGANRLQRAAWGWRTLAVPVIAAVHGVAFGAGCQVMLGADIRIVAPDAQLSIMETRWGLVPDLGGIALLRGLVRDDVARELVYTARIVSGAEAAALGLATRAVADPRAAALSLAQSIAGRAPAAIRAGKRLLNAMPEHDAATLLLAESREQSALLGSPDHAEALRAAAERREPVFAN